SGMDQRDGKALEENLHLRPEQVHADGFNFRYKSGRLRHDARDCGQSVNAKCAKRFELCLDAGSAAAVGSGYGESDRWRGVLYAPALFFCHRFRRSETAATD